MHVESAQSQMVGSRAVSLIPRDPSPAELGRRIKLARVARGLTLKNLEDRGGISATHVSEIERGKASPTVGALARIARALGVRPAALIEPDVLPEITHSTAEERVARRSVWEGMTLEPLTQPIERAVTGTYLVHLAAGEQGTRPATAHEGEEWVLLLDGVVEIRVDAKPQVLRAGDSLHYWAHHAHSYANLGNSPARLLVACRPRLGL
jgi:transcriptional regulator with XRE-family HTH domain